MNIIKSFAASFCVICAVTGGISLLFPERKNQKILRLAISVSILFFIISFAFSFPEINLPEQKDSFTDITAKDTVKNLQTVFETALKQNDIKYKSVEIITDKNESGSIIISKVTVYTDEPLEKIKKAIGNDGNYEVETVNG